MHLFAMFCSLYCDVLLIVFLVMACGSIHDNPCLMKQNVSGAVKIDPIALIEKNVRLKQL